MMGMLSRPGAFFGLLAFGMPVGFAIGVAGMIGISDMGPRFMTMAPDRLFAGLDLFPFLAMPFFILAGEIMNRSGITHSLVKLADTLVGWLRGGMAHSNMVASVMFAGITGSATADAAAFGNTLVPAMQKGGYRPCLRLRGDRRRVDHRADDPAVHAGDHLRLDHGRLHRRPVRRRHPAGPADLRRLHARDRAHRQAQEPAQGRQAGRLGAFLGRAEEASWRRFCRCSSSARSSAASRRRPKRRPSPSPMRCFVGGVIYRALTWQDLYEICVRTTRITGVIFLIIASATILGWWMTFNQIPQAIAPALLSIPENPSVVIGLILLLLLLIGLVMDINATLIILAPVLAPLTLQIGMDPVHAGIMIILALNISLMTPPSAPACSCSPR
jgi:hypothetical protein